MQAIQIIQKSQTGNIGFIIAIQNIIKIKISYVKYDISKITN